MNVESDKKSDPIISEHMNDESLRVTFQKCILRYVYYFLKFHMAE